MDNVADIAVAQTAREDFARAYRKAFFSDIFASLSGRPKWLVSFQEVERLLPIKGQHYKGLQQVPVAAIIGSVDRYHDFNRAFLPVQTQTRPRWESVDRAAITDVPLPPVQLYKIGGVYFVKDGNHRVSVARERGQEFIDAEVIECTTRVPLPANVDPREMLLLAEYARFLEATKLDYLRPGHDIRFSALGRYDDLLEHISVHRWFMGTEQFRTVTWEEAVLDWYDHVYLPMVEAIKSKDTLADFPGRTPADLYLWIMEHRWYLREELGYDVGPELAAVSYNEKYATSWTRRVVRYLRRLQTATTRPVVVTAQLIGRAVTAARQSGDPNSGGDASTQDGSIPSAASDGAQPPPE